MIAMVALQPTVQVEGPPPGLASGRYDVPRWTIGLLGALIVLSGILYLVARTARRKKPSP